MPSLFAFMLGILCGLLWIGQREESFLLKQMFEGVNNKLLLFLRAFQNKYVQPLESGVWEGGIKKALLDQVRVEPYWQKPTTNPFGTR